MTNDFNENESSELFEKYLWNSMNVLRGKIDQSEFLDHLLPLIFLKFISEQKELSSVEDGFFDIPEEASWSSLLRGIELSGKKIDAILGKLEDSVPVMSGLFTGLDYERIHLYSGNDFIDVINQLDQIQLTKMQNFPSMFDNLFDKIADYQGYKGGEFRTPKTLSKLLVQLASLEPDMAICDPTCGSGGFLVAAYDYVKENNPNSEHTICFGQEKNINTWSKCKMNLILHGLTDSRVELGDTIVEPKLIAKEELLKFDRVISNPPFSLRNWGQEFAQFDQFNRFRFGIPPKSYGDYAFVQHAIATLRESGKAVMILAHGPLFRGGAEKDIREKLIKEDIIESIISLPPKLLYGTSIPCVIIVLNKAKTPDRRGKIQFINATGRGRVERSQTHLREVDIDWIVKSYKAFREVKGFVKIVNLDTIARNDYNLDVARYFESVKTHVTSRITGDYIKGKGFENWVEELPFPIASILWSYTSIIDPEQKTKSLLHFFEAMSQFNTTLMLSAITKDIDFFEEHFSKVITKDVFSRSSFGGWVLVGVRLASKIRKLMKRDEVQRRCIEVFGNVDDSIISLLTDERLAKVLKETSELRNNWKGHDGAVTKAEYSQRLTKLEKFLIETRKIVKNRYSSMVLVMPGIVERYQNETFYNIVKELRGTRTPFKEIRIETALPLESDMLHFIADGGNVPIRLFPFLRIMHSPETEKNACYFYNRVDDEGVRWITYQFEKESSLTLPDEDVVAAIEMIKPTKSD